jgi:hypothetical protein
MNQSPFFLQISGTSARCNLLEWNSPKPLRDPD